MESRWRENVALCGWTGGPLTLAARLVDGPLVGWFVTNRKLGGSVWGLQPDADMQFRPLQDIFLAGGNPALPFPYNLNVESDNG